jgi:hypothetical protein
METKPVRQQNAMQTQCAKNAVSAHMEIEPNGK